MTRVGRPKATYADSVIELAQSRQGGWVTEIINACEADKMVRKLRREGYEAKALRLDDRAGVLAVRTTGNEQHHAGADALAERGEGHRSS